MILGVDHIALSCANIRQAAERLKQDGFTVQFIDESIPNAPAKSKLLHTYQPVHSLAYCKGASGISIELIQHRAETSKPSSCYEVLLSLPAQAAFQRMESPAGPAEIWSETVRRHDLAFGALSELQATCWNAPPDNGAKVPAVRSVMVPVEDMDRAVEFWNTGLGAKTIEQGRTRSGVEWVNLKILSPVAVWSLEVVLAKMDAEKPFLDSAGFTCLAFLTNNLKQDVERLAQAGAREITDAFSLSVNKKPLSILLLRGPSDELIELIQIAR